MKLRTSRVWYLMQRIDVEAGTASCLFAPKDVWGRSMDLETLGRLCAEAWHDDLPEADRTWAEAHREKFGRSADDSRPEAIRPRGDAGSLQSLPGRFDKEPAPPRPMLLEAVKSAFFTFVVDFGLAKGPGCIVVADERAREGTRSRCGGGRARSRGDQDALWWRASALARGPGCVVVAGERAREGTRMRRGGGRARQALPENATARGAFLVIAALGGHLRRNGEPGWQTLGRGYEQPLLLIQGWSAAKEKGK